MSAFAYDIGERVKALDAAAAEPAETDDAKLCARFLISSTHLDRDGDVVEVQGLNTAAHEQNPVVFFDHKKSGIPFPIALSQTPAGVYTVEVQKDRAYGTAYFKSAVRESVQIYHLVKAGLLRAASIGFIPSEFEPRQKGQRGMWHKKGELTEWSIVGVPANPYALRAEMGKGLIAGSPISDELKAALEPHMAERRQAIANGATLPVEGAVDESAAVMGTTLGELIDVKGKAVPDPDPDDADRDVDDVSDDLGDDVPGPDAPELPAAVQALLDEDELLVSITCPREAFGGTEDAKKWCRSKGYSTDIVQQTETGWHFAQSECALEPLTDFRKVELEAGATGLVAKQLALRIPKYVQSVRLKGAVIGGELQLTLTQVYNDGREVSTTETVECSGLFDPSSGLDPEGVPDDPGAVLDGEGALTAAEELRLAEMEKALRANTLGLDEIRKMFRQLTGK